MSTTATAPTRQKITTFLWFDNQAEEAMEHLELALVLFREISCNFVDRVLKIRNHTIRLIR